MGFNPGDTYRFILNIPNHVSGDITSTPTITIVDLQSSTVLVTAQTMTIIAGTGVAYVYTWTIPSSPANDDYLAVVSYAISSTPFNNQVLEKLHVGDSYLPSQAALNATVAKDSTVAKAATTLQVSGYVSPDNSTRIQSIQSAVAALPSVVASASDMATVLTNLADVHDATLGNWIIDKNANTLTLYKITGSILQVFSLVNTANLAERLR